MATVIKNDIQTLLRLFDGFLEQEDKLIRSVVQNYVRRKTGNGYVNWNERQRRNILKQFEFFTTKQRELQDEINEHYIIKFVLTSDLDARYELTLEYLKIARMVWGRIPSWLDTLETNLPHIQDISETDLILPIFRRLLGRMKTPFSCGLKSCDCQKYFEELYINDRIIETTSDSCDTEIIDIRKKST